MFNVPIMKQLYKILFWLLFYVGCIVFVGLFTLSIDVATRETIFIALIGCFALGFGIRKSNWITPIGKLYLVSSVAFFFYVIAGLILNPSLWYAGPAACLLTYTLGFFLADKKFLLAYALLIGSAFFYYAFAWYPHKSKIEEHKYYSNNIDLSDTTLIWKDSIGINRIGELSNQVVLIETWNEYCGNCFSGMRDLHPFLNEQEKLYKNFKHVYLYTRPLRGGETTISVEKTFRNKWLPPYSDMLVLQDENQTFYKKYLPEGFPHYILINKDGKVLFSFQGYQKKFKPAYQSYIAKELKKAFQNNS